MLSLLVVVMAPVAPGGGLADVVTACVRPNGRARIVEAAEGCRRRERAVSWNREGPEGPRGRRGRRGRSGSDGAPGPQGPAGVGGGLDRASFYERSAVGAEVSCDDGSDLLLSCRCEATGLGGRDAFGYATPFHTTDGATPDACRCTFPQDPSHNPVSVAVCVERGDAVCGGEAPPGYGQVCENECSSGTMGCDGGCDAEAPPEGFGEACETGCYCPTTPFNGISLIGLEGEVGCDGTCSGAAAVACLGICGCARGGEAEACAYTCACGAEVGGVACGGTCLARREACEEACGPQERPVDGPAVAAP